MTGTYFKLLRLSVAFAIVIVLGFSQTSHVAAFPIVLEEPLYYIDVSVATVWRQPDQTRNLDAPTISDDVDMAKWTKSMKLADKLWLVGKLETQALYGQRVDILERKGDWVKIAVYGQPTPLHHKGYPGWVPVTQLTSSSSYEALSARLPEAIIQSPVATLFNDYRLKDAFIDVSFNTRLLVLKQWGNLIMVRTPGDGNKWVRKSDVRIIEAQDSIPTPTQSDIIKTASKFLKLPYLWAGTSGFGFDCSGFTHTIYKFHGITIPRDASVQAVHGIAINKDELQPGDLLFFARDKGKGKVHHVGMYAGNGMMIHSPSSDKAVELISIDTPAYANEFAGAKRYLSFVR